MKLTIVSTDSTYSNWIRRKDSEATHITRKLDHFRAGGKCLCKSSSCVQECGSGSCPKVNKTPNSSIEGISLLTKKESPIEDKKDWIEGRKEGRSTREERKERAELKERKTMKQDRKMYCTLIIKHECFLCKPHTHIRTHTYAHPHASCPIEID